MTTLNIGKVRCTYEGTWDSTEAYDILSRVEDEDGILYESIKAVPAGTLLTNTSYWVRISGPIGPQGEKGDEGQKGVKGDTGTAPDAVLYTEQALTEVQKTQARTNLGWAAAFAASFATSIAAWVTEHFNSLVEAYLVPILKQLILANGGTQADIDAIESENQNQNS